LALVDYTLLFTEVTAGLAVAVIIAIGTVLYRRRRKQSHSVYGPKLVEKPKPIDVNKLIVKRAFYVPIERDQVISRVAEVLRNQSMSRYHDNSSRNVAEFIANAPMFLQRYDPETWRKIVKDHPNVDDAVKEVERVWHWRPVTPTSVKVRVVSEYQGESYCEAECYPELYDLLLRAEFTPRDDIESEQITRIAENECRGLLDDLITHLAGRTVKPEEK
jgi:hypothetical protein